MNRLLRWKVISILVVFVVFGAVGVYPLFATLADLPAPRWLMSRKLPLGLDLQGGVQFAIRVEADYALRLESEAAMTRLREALQAAAIANPSTTLVDATHFRIDGVVPELDAAIQQAATSVPTTFERQPGGAGRYTFAMKPASAAQLREETVTRTRETIERRINELGVSEPSVARQGQNGDQILIQLPGMTNVDRAREIIQAGGVLELKLVEQSQSASVAADRGSHSQRPPDTEVLEGPLDASDRSAAMSYVVKTTPVVTGRHLRNARPSVDENGRPAVSFTLDPEGGRLFAWATAENIGRQLAIVLDGRVHSAPRIDGRITTEGSIHGGFTPQEAQDLALILRSGALPAPLTYLSQQTIGPSLGADSIRRGALASALGLLLVIDFMVAYYRLSGVVAAVALVLNLVTLLGLMASVGAVMTLPGVAGFVLTMGIGVDSNVLIFERIKEELDAGRTVRASIRTGFGRVFLTLLDTHIAALLSAAFLFLFGTGAIRGFAVTLSLGLLSNLFTSTFVSRTLFELGLTCKERPTVSI